LVGGARKETWRGIECCWSSGSNVWKPVWALQKRRSNKATTAVRRVRAKTTA
jgi:hypothetical protein